MIDSIVIAAIFLLAGFVKGVIGLGLPTIAMGLLVLLMRPVEAASLLILPALVTNLWQSFAGPHLASCVRRFWPMLVGICVGCWAGIGLLTNSPYASGLLGVALLAYSATGLARLPPLVGNAHETILAPIVGAMTGLVTAAAGVAVVPTVPYLGSLGLDRETLVQILGLSFTVSTIALAINLLVAGDLHLTLAGNAVIALIAASAGTWFGQAVRSRLSQALFRRWFFIGLLCFGTYLVTSAFV